MEDLRKLSDEDLIEATALRVMRWRAAVAVGHDYKECWEDRQGHQHDKTKWNPLRSRDDCKDVVATWLGCKLPAVQNKVLWTFERHGLSHREICLMAILAAVMSSG